MNVKPVPSHLYRRLTEARKAWKLSVVEVAERVGCEPATLRKYELGLTLPSVSMLLRWADALGYDLSLWPKGQGRASA